MGGGFVYWAFVDGWGYRVEREWGGFYGSQYFAFNFHGWYLSFMGAGSRALFDCFLEKGRRKGEGTKGRGSFTSNLRKCKKFFIFSLERLKTNVDKASQSIVECL